MTPTMIINDASRKINDNFSDSISHAKNTPDTG